MIAAILLLALVLLSPALRAEEYPKMERITTEQGLSQNMVFAIHQDREGFLWLGTRDGLNRYDGYGFMVFRHDPLDPESLPWTSVMCITEDSDGNIWLASFGRLCRLDRRTFRFVTVSYGAGNSLVRAIHGDRSGNVWIGTVNGLVRYDTRSGRLAYFHANRADPGALACDTIVSLYEDHEGALWIGTGRGCMHRYNPARGNFTRYGSGLPGADEVCCLGEDAEGTIYSALALPGERYAVLGMDRSTGAVVSTFFNSPKQIRQCSGWEQPMFIDPDGGLWVQMLSQGGADHYTARTILRRIPLCGRGRGITITAPADQPLDRIRKIVRDRSGTLWLGTENGVLKVNADEPRFHTYRNIPGDPASLSDDRVRGIIRDRFGTLWVGTDNGLNRLDSGSSRWVRYLYSREKFSSNGTQVVNTIFEDTDGALLIGTNHGFYRYDRRTNRISDGRVRKLAVWSFCRDDSGTLWVGTHNEGILRYDRNGYPLPSVAQRANDSTAIIPALVWDMHRDRNGVLWIATSDGLYRRLPGREVFRKYGVYPADPHGLTEASVCAIMEDASGGLWFSTYAGGLNRYNPASDGFTSITSHDGLPSDAIYGALMDASGKLWISSNTGLVAYNPAARTCRVYNAGDGLQGNEFSFKAFFKAEDGEMIFGGIHGISVFQPDSLYARQEKAPVVVTEFRVFDRLVRRELLSGDTVETSYGQDFISFQFAALDYANHSGIRYVYRLDGFDAEWINCGERRYASFTNLDPGTYTFTVNGSNRDGMWSTCPLSIVLRVVPPFWMTWWFRTGVLMGAGLAIAVAVMLRLRFVRAQEALRRRSVESQLHALRLHVNPHFIFNALSSIQHLILIMEPDRAVEYLARFAQLVRAVLENSERTSIPLADEIATLSNYLDLELLRFEGRFHYAIEVDAALDTHRVSIPTMLIQPCVENAIRHGLHHKAGLGNLRIAIEGRADRIRCTIEDNGVGRRRAAELRPTNGHAGRPVGMRVTEERLKILNAVSSGRGQISMEITDLFHRNGDPAGTRVELFIPIEST
ncbi:MAG: histidine kinase [Bacteroidetes bacterium]|nr:histidine kinase [Bacteroidota bacterium]